MDILYSQGFHAWITIAVVLASFATLLRTKLPVYIVFATGVVVLTLTGCIDLKTATAGFSSSTMAMLVGLFFVIAALEATGFMALVARKMLGTPSGYNSTILRLMLTVGALSAFLSNTAVVAMFVKIVKHWAKQLNIAPSKLLIPLSYASNIGGTILLIGSPTNLIITDYYKDKSGVELSLAFPLVAGIVCLAVGIVSVIAMQKLLPTRQTPAEQIAADEKVTEVQVPARSRFVGETLHDSALDSEFLSGADIQLIGIVRFDGEVISNVTDSEFLMGGDTLLLTGNSTDIQKRARLLGFQPSSLSPQLSSLSSNSSRRLPLAIIIMLAAVLLPMFDVLPIAQSFMAAAILMLLTRCCSVAEGRAAIDGDTILTFGCSLAYGKAIEETGLAQMAAESITWMSGSNAFIALILVCFFATFLTEFISNIACAAMIIPIALEICDALSANPLTFCLGLLISCSCSFATPTGSMPNLLVYAPGGYRFSDFVRIGIPMNVIILIANVVIATILFPL